MKNIISITLIFFYLIAFADAPTQEYKGTGCVDNLGHMFYDIDSIHFKNTGCEWYVDTFAINDDVDTTWYGVYVVKRAGCDTTFFTCLKCDTVGYYASDTVKIFQRSFVVRP